MKKLMIAAFALCAAYGAQAMAVDWKAGTGNSSSAKDYMVYLIIGDTVKTDWTSADAVVAASVGSKKIAQSGPQYTTGTVTSQDDSITKSGNFYLVIVKSDKSQFAVSDTFAASTYVYDNKASPPETSTATASWTATSAIYQNFAASPVPEPTSGLLLLLGVAGLALKRKHA